MYPFFEDGVVAKIVLRSSMESEISVIGFQHLFDMAIEDRIGLRIQVVAELGSKRIKYRLLASFSADSMTGCDHFDRFYFACFDSRQNHIFLFINMICHSVNIIQIGTVNLVKKYDR